MCKMYTEMKAMRHIGAPYLMVSQFEPSQKYLPPVCICFGTGYRSSIWQEDTSGSSMAPYPFVKAEISRAAQKFARSPPSTTYVPGGTDNHDRL
jgi:hypothetical protein